MIRPALWVVAAAILVACAPTQVVAGTAVPETDSPTTAVAAPQPNPVAARIAELLAALPRVAELPQVPGYDRSCSPGAGCVFGPAWTDVARSGCDTRNRVLSIQLRDVQFKPGTRDCKVTAGVLDDPYTGTLLTYGDADIQIDHVFALGRAWDAGAAAWTYDERVLFANDMANLLAVDGAVNQTKSDAGPDSWLPPNRTFVCPFIEIYLTSAVKYGLTITDQDAVVASTACPSR